MKLREEAIQMVIQICDRYKHEPSPLMLILSDVQKEYGYIPMEVQQIISAKTGIPVSEIYGVDFVVSVSAEKEEMIGVNFDGCEILN